MWTLYQKASKYSKPPSDYFPDLVDEWAIYQFDNAVTYFGMVIENALLERSDVGVGASQRSVQRHTLQDLLDPEYQLPREGAEVIDMLKGMDGYDEVE